MRRQSGDGRSIGTPIALVRLEPQQLTARSSLKFEDSHDDLDYVRVAWVDDNTALVRHIGAPTPGTEIIVTDFEPARPLRAVEHLDTVLRKLDLTVGDVTWRHPVLAKAVRSRGSYRLGEMLRRARVFLFNRNRKNSPRFPR